MKQAALYQKIEPEVQPFAEAPSESTRYDVGRRDEGDWSPRRRLGVLVAAALASWGLVIGIGYGIYSLFA
ncbi:hypothetical protein [Skermanella stibiiresistens]|uniref:hypothetical protein n=1 Tax=Skermanella stibiiresistens TaxID=913326 RepID=UPI001B3C02FB|nr:hypothetical protein [Skermanella stibiiresistens]